MSFKRYSDREIDYKVMVSIKAKTDVEYRRTRSAHWNAVAKRFDHWKGAGGLYHRRMTEVYRFLVPPGQKVLEIGCAQGDLLSALKPAIGIGVDFSSEMLERARKRHPEIFFVLADAHELILAGSKESTEFDIIILSDLLNDLWDVQVVLEQISQYCTPRTRIIINNYSRLWEIPLGLAKCLRLAKPTLSQNWLQLKDVLNLLCLADFEIIRSWPEFLWPLPIPLVKSFFNRFLVKFWPFRWFALSNFIVARPRPEKGIRAPQPRVSVSIPARNESGNIAKIFARVPELGSGTELVFVEGHSKDDTYAEIERQIAAHPKRRCRLIRQTGIGKGDAIRLGFTHASGDILMILDADLTVPPEDLSRFYEALIEGKGEFINGTRLVYPMEKQAMRFFNLLGNKFFCLAFSWLLGQPVRDTLCGTKALWKKDYESIARNRTYFGDFDPFGDYDLLFGAARLSLKIIDLPIRYRERTYGTTNIQRWKHGWLLFKMVIFAAARIKFV